MPQWVLVSSDADGTPIVMTGWIMTGTFAAIDDVKAGTVRPVVFSTRWTAKRAIRQRNEWREWRCVRRDRL